MIYDEGFEINVGGLSLFFFFKYDRNLDASSSQCDATLNGTDLPRLSLRLRAR